MSLLNFFRPAWQNSDPQVRKDAIVKLPSDNQDVFESVALTDEDVDVRASAIHKLTSSESLRKVIAKETDPANKRDAESRLLDSIASYLRSFRSAATQKELDFISEIADSRYAEDLLKSMPSSELRLALAKLCTKQNALTSAALKDPKEEVALAALEHIDRANLLQDIFQNSRHTSVRKKAGETLRLHKEVKNSEENATLMLFRKREALVQQAHHLADSKDFMTNSPAFDALIKEATDLGMGPAQAEFDQVLQSYKTRRAEEQKRIEDASAAVIAKEDKKKSLEAILSELDALLEANVRENKEKIGQLISKFKEVNAGEDSPIFKLFNLSLDRFNKFVEKEDSEAKEASEKAASRSEIIEQLKILVNEEPTEALERKVKALARTWETMPLMEGNDPELQTYNSLRSQLSEKINSKNEADRKDFDEKTVKLRAIIDDVKKINENEDFKEIAKKLRESYKAWKEIVGEAKFRFQEIWKEYSEATSRFKEMQEWESWYNERDRESLLEEMTLLSKEEPSKDVLYKLRGFANQWKAIGPVSAARLNEFRDNFRKLFEEIMAKCEPLLKEQEEERKKNLEQKEAICAKAETLASDDANNWRDKYKVMQDLQEEWKSVGPVPKENNQPIWDRFHAAENIFYTKHKEFLKQEDIVREENYQKKLVLCERAEKLAESSDWNATSAEYRKLQEDWKTSGPAPKSKSEEIWARFRKACDGFFERKRAHFNELDNEKAKNLEAKEALCAKLEELDLDPNNAETVKTVDEINEAWKAIGMVPKEKVDSIWERFSSALDKFEEKRAEMDPVYRTQMEEAKTQKENILQTIAQLMDNAGSNQNSDTVKSMQVDWKKLPRCGSAEQDLYKKFREACDEFFTRHRDQLEIQEQARENNLQKKVMLCEQAERLLAALSDENRRESMNEVKQLRRLWREIGAVPRKDSDKVWNRFNTACDAVFGNIRNEQKQTEAPVVEAPKEADGQPQA